MEHWERPVSKSMSLTMALEIGSGSKLVISNVMSLEIAKLVHSSRSRMGKLTSRIGKETGSEEIFLASDGSGSGVGSIE